MNQNRKIVITGGNGFIGLNVAKRLHDQGEYVRIVDSSDDQTFRRYKNIHDACSEFIKGDLRDVDFCRKAVTDARQIFHFAANMGGMGVIHPANNFTIYKDNHLMTLNVLEAAMAEKVERFFFASTACVYPNSKQSDHTDEDLQLKESDAWAVPQPQEFYGTEKLCGELLVAQFGASYNISVQIARFHNVYGEGSAWFGGREKAPAALLRKAICAGINEQDRTIEVWGSGKQRRSFLYIDDCVDAVLLLAKSDYAQPLNIGSDEAVSIAELAYIAFETIGISRNLVNIVPDPNKPIGVQNRNSDNTLNKKVLGWSPKIDIREGMRRMSKWIQAELTNQLSNVNEIQRTLLFDKYKYSVVKSLAKDEITFGVLLPITSRGLSKPENCIANLQKFAKSLRDSTKSDRSNFFDKIYKLKVYIGIDQDDTFFHPAEDNCAKRTLMEYGIVDIETMIFDYPPGSICAIWRGLARKAYDQGCQYAVLFGDDVVLKTSGWMSRIDDAFHALAVEKHVPYGFGCVTFRDLSFPGFPTFPVISRVHLDIFKGDVIPSEFVNQGHGDPYLFQLYRRWGCSVMLQDVTLTNTVGGEIISRYEKKYQKNWTFDILDTGVNSVQTWLEKKSPTTPPPLLTLDIIIPSYRVQMKYLEPMIRLNRSPTSSTMVIIVVDNPASPNIDILKKCYEHDPFIRIRVHDTNMGASAARNRGLSESAADYVLYLDDDVTPDPNILLECEKIIRQYPLACGFVGSTKFPDPTPRIATSAITMWGGTFFWNICEYIEDDIPWGVTANLLARRYKDNVWFSDRFPKTGGGEDMDYCFKKKRFFLDNVPGGESFRAAPNVKAIHPWWNNGGRVYKRFWGWAFGDGALIKMYPEFTYRDFAPNTAETLLIAVTLALVTLPVTMIVDMLVIRRLLIIFLITIPLIPVANIIFDVHHHMIVEPTACVPALRGYRRILAAAESSIIKMVNDWGRLEGHIRRKEWSCFGRRFEWFTGRHGNVPMAHERRNSVYRFLILVGLVALVAGSIFA